MSSEKDAFEEADLTAQRDHVLSADVIRDIARQAAQDAAEQAARSAIRDVLERLGFDTTDPRATRQDADWLRDARLRSADPEYQRDRLYLRNQRLAHEQMMPVIRRTAIGLILTGFATATWLGFRELLAP